MTTAYHIEFSPSAYKQFKKLDKQIQFLISKKIEVLVLQPRPLGIKKLSGVKDLYRMRIGNYRVIYNINDLELLILVVKVGSRGDVYKSL